MCDISSKDTKLFKRTLYDNYTVLFEKVFRTCAKIFIPDVLKRYYIKKYGNFVFNILNI